MPHVKQLLDSDPNWLDTLVNKYKISVTPCETGRLVSLKYNQIESPMNEPIVQECRGMVVDTVLRKILAFPYTKFWNLGEYLAAPIDWKTARVQDKLDGSLMQLYWDPVGDNEGGPGWAVASSGHPTAGGRVGADERKFRDLFWDTFAELGMRLPDETWIRVSETTFIFELCRMENRIVVKHEKPRLVCHGARHVPTEREWIRDHLEETCAEYNWEIVKEYPISTAEDAVKAAEALNPVEGEGFVVVDGDFNRVKIKSPRYVALHHLKGDIVTDRRVANLWQTGEVDELLTHFPELQQDILPVILKLETIAAKAVSTFNEHKDLPTRKDFALAVKSSPLQAILFKLYTMEDRSHDAVKQLMRNMTVYAVEDLLNTAL